MRRLFALILVFGLWFSFASPAKAVEDNLQANLVRCSDSPAFIQRAENARNTTSDPQSGINRFERYAQAMCGPEGLPHLIVDGRLDRIGDFTIPGILFLYLAGWIGWAGRSYLQSVKKQTGGASELKEVVIDVPLALKAFAAGATWPIGSVKELLTGELTAKDEEIPVSPR